MLSGNCTQRIVIDNYFRTVTTFNSFNFHSRKVSYCKATTPTLGFVINSRSYDTRNLSYKAGLHGKVPAGLATKYLGQSFLLQLVRSLIYIEGYFPLSLSLKPVPSGIVTEA